MPQFDPTFFSTQLFWLAVTFVVLYIVVSSSAVPKIGSVLEDRQRKIDDNLGKAARLKAEAEAAIAAYEQALTDSRAKAQTILRDTADTLARQAEARQKDLGERLAAQIKAGEARIATAKEQALASVLEIATDVAKSATSRLTGIDLSDNQVAAAVAAVSEGR